MAVLPVVTQAPRFLPLSVCLRLVRVGFNQQEKDRVLGVFPLSVNNSSIFPVVWVKNVILDSFFSYLTAGLSVNARYPSLVAFLFFKLRNQKDTDKYLESEPLQLQPSLDLGPMF